MKAFQSLLSRLRQFGPQVPRRAGRPRPAISSAWYDGGEGEQVTFEVVRTLARTVLYPLACVALTTALVAVVLRYTELEFASIVYLVPVLICAIRWGLVSAIVSVFASAVVAAVGAATRQPVVRLPTLGGSIPMFLFDDVLGVPALGLPIANHDNNQHAANENLRVQNLRDGIAIFATVLAEAGKAWP